MGKFQIIVEKYYFQKPNIIAITQYTNLKSLLANNPELKLNKTAPVWKVYKFVFIIFAIFLFGILIGGTFDIDGLFTIGMIAFILLIMLLLNGSAASMINYYKYVEKRDDFYKKLKELIISSRDYNDFTTRYRSL